MWCVDHTPWVVGYWQVACLHTPLTQYKHPNMVWGLIKLTRGVCRGLSCYAASPEKIFVYEWVLREYQMIVWCVGHTPWVVCTQQCHRRATVKCGTAGFQWVEYDHTHLVFFLSHGFWPSNILNWSFLWFWKKHIPPGQKAYHIVMWYALIPYIPHHTYQMHVVCYQPWLNGFYKTYQLLVCPSILKCLPLHITYHGVQKRIFKFIGGKLLINTDPVIKVKIKKN